MSKEERRRLFEQRIRENEDKQARLEEEEAYKLKEEEERKRQEKITTQLEKQENNMEELSKRISTLFPDPLLITQQTLKIEPQTRLLQPMDISSPSPPQLPPPLTINKKKKRPKLPPNWKMAKNSKGRVYYYHVITKKSQWHFPRENKKVKKESTRKKQNIDLNNLTDNMKKQKELFREELSKIVRKQLTPYMKSDCHIGRISNTDDFKYLARKFTHSIMERELERAVNNSEELSVNKRVKIKTQEYITKYMLKFNGDYSRKKDS
jgi:[histone H3]-lysine36 N-trimethyltransferase